MEEEELRARTGACGAATATAGRFAARYFAGGGRAARRFFRAERRAREEQGEAEQRAERREERRAPQTLWTEICSWRPSMVTGSAARRLALP